MAHVVRVTRWYYYNPPSRHVTMEVVFFDVAQLCNRRCDDNHEVGMKKLPTLELAHSFRVITAASPTTVACWGGEHSDLNSVLKKRNKMISFSPSDSASQCTWKGVHVSESLRVFVKTM